MISWNRLFKTQSGNLFEVQKCFPSLYFLVSTAGAVYLKEVFKIDNPNKDAHFECIICRTNVHDS